MADTDDLNLIKFRLGEAKDGDTGNNIARFDTANKKIHYRGTDFGLSDDEKAQFALSADVPTLTTISSIADTEIAKANTNTTLTNYATTASVKSVSDEVAKKTTMSEVEAKGYITAAYLDGYATENWVTGQHYITSAALEPYATTANLSSVSAAVSANTSKLSGIESNAQVNKIEVVKVNGTALEITSKAVNVVVPTKVGDLTNDKNFITSASTVSSAISASNASLLAGNSVATISAMTNDTSKIGNGAGYITTAATVASAVSATNADTLDGLHASGVSALTNDTSKIGNGAGYITTAATVASAQSATKVANALTIQRNGTQIGKTFNGSAATTINISVPTDTNELSNGAGFITTAAIPTSNTAFTNDANYITTAAIPTSNTAFTNDANYITTADTVAQANKVKGTLTIQRNGTTVKTFNGSGNVTANISVPTDTSALTNGAGFITTASIPTSNTAFTNDAKYITSAAIPTSNTAFTNDANYITTAATVASAVSASNADLLDGYHASGISAMTNDTSKIANGAGFITTAATVAQANKVTGVLTIQKNGSNVNTYNGSGNVTANIVVPTKTSDITNDSGFITTSSTVANADKLDNLHASEISALTNDTSKIGNGANYITSAAIPTKVSSFDNDANYINSSATVAQANKVKGTLTIQKNGTNVQTFNGSGSVTANITTPTKVSELTNDSNFITSANTVASAQSATNADTLDSLHASDISALTNNTSKLTNGANFITSAVSSLANFYDKTAIDNMVKAGFSAVTAATLPVSGENNKIYFISASTTGTSNIYDEYMYINSKWEHIGTTETELGNYYLKTATSSKTEIDNALAKYLPLAGGTMTGQLNGTTITASTIKGTSISGTNVNGPTITGTTVKGTNISGTTVKGDTVSASTFATSSTALVSNLNSDLLDGKHAADFSLTSHTHDYLPLAGGTMSGTISSQNITPKTNYTYDLGSTSSEYQNAYIRQISARHLDADKVFGSDYTLYLGYGTNSARTDKINFYNSTSSDSRTMQMQISSAGVSATTIKGVNISGTTVKGTTVSGGTFATSSTALVSNLNADLLDGHHATDFALASSLGDYLPLAGGTVTGATTFKGYNYITTNANSGYSPSHCFQSNGTTFGYIGFLSANTPTVWSADASKKYTILHSGNSAHTHTTGQVTGLGTMATQATSSYSTATEVSTALAGKANSSHTHTSGQVTGLGTMALQNTGSYSTATEVSTALAGKANSSHTHTSGQVTGLGTMALQNTGSYSTATQVSTALAGKADSSHTHTSSQISDALTANSVTSCLWNATNSAKVLTESMLAYWNGTTTTDNGSNLSYCSKGAFGTMATANTSSYSTATEVSNALAGKSDTSHTHNYITSQGRTRTAAVLPDSYGTNVVCVNGAYSSTATGWPSTYGNVITINNAGGNQIFMDWSGSQSADGQSISTGMWIRSKRDNVNGWTTWTKVVTSANSAHTHSDYATTASLGSMAYKASGDYYTAANVRSYFLPLSGGTLTNALYGTTISAATIKGVSVSATNFATNSTTVVSNLNADLLDGLHAAGISALTNNTNKLTNGAGFITSTEAANTYLPLSGGKMTGRISGFAGTVDLVNNSSYTILGYDETGCTNCTAGTVVGSIEKQTYLRSSGDNLYHYNANKTTSYKILDAGNYDTVLSGAYVHKSGDTMSGPLKINPGNTGNYTEGVRINQANDGWSLVQLGGAANSASGTNDGCWIIGRRGTTGATFGVVGDLCIENGDSRGNSGVTINKAGSIITNGTLNTSKSLRIGCTLGGGSTLTGGVTEQYNSTTQALEFVFS